MIPGLPNTLSAIADFLEWQQRFASIEGLLADLEGYTLMQLAAGGPGVGAIVEIGSFMGRSTAFLAAGSKGAGREKVVAVDHFRGSPEHQPGQPYAVPILAQEGSTLGRFQQNLRQLGLDDHVNPIMASSAEAAVRWQGPIRLLFIDGDHSYEASKQDFELWSPFVVPHGMICFHDIPGWEGATRFYRQLLSGTSTYREAGTVLSMKIVQKLPAGKVGGQESEVGARRSEASLRQALAAQPGDVEAWSDLAAVLQESNRLPEAALALKRTLRLRSDFHQAQKNLQSVRAAAAAAGVTGAGENNRGVQLLAQRRYVEAEAVFRQALALEPTMPPEAHYNLAKSLQAQEQFAEAEGLYQLVLSQRPAWAECHFSLANLYFAQGRLTEAEAAYRQILRHKSDHVEALNSLAANVLTYEGRTDEARTVYDQALALQPGHAVCHSNLLLNEQYRPAVTLAGLAEAHAGWERQHAQPLRSTWRPFAQSQDRERPVRLGLVSGDFGLHPVGLFLAPVLERLDRAEWYTVCYANQRKADEQTQRLTRAASLWRNVADLSDEALAEQIRGDGIDLLIDLSGHTGGNRLLTFARRPAPVQLTWMAYVGTTGLSAMDYLLADHFHVPPGREKDFVEKVLRLPEGYLCYEPPSYAPAVGPLPALSVGHVTFGAFHNTAKITPNAIAVWADILRQLPDARLLLKTHWLDDAGLRRRLTEQFAAHGIAAERLELLGKSGHRQHLEQYLAVDIALDSFPYSGGLTTCEACWMGVPVVTCPGETFASRHSLSHLSNIGLTETITANLADYVRTAVRLANPTERQRLAELRAGLRPSMAGSPLCDADRFARHFSAALRERAR